MQYKKMETRLMRRRDGGNTKGRGGFGGGIEKVEKVNCRYDHDKRSTVLADI